MYDYTHIKEIPKTQYLVSLLHSYEKSASMEIFDISKKGKIKRIYTSEMLIGGKMFTLNVTTHSLPESFITFINRFNSIK